MTKDKVSLLLPITLALLSLAVAAYTGYNSNDKDLTSRVVALEVEQSHSQKAVERIEQKVDRILSDEFIRRVRGW